jgi:ferredoxin
MITETVNKVKRQIIRIDADKCTGCGECIPNCPEGALQVIDGKARLISDLFCDGLGACIGHCPEDAITTEERQAEPYDERRVMSNIVKQGANVIKAHLEHLKGHGQHEYLNQAVEFLKERNIPLPGKEPGAHKPHHLPCGCPSSSVQTFKRDQAPGTDVTARTAATTPKAESALTQWPVQLMLVPPGAPFLQGRDLVIAADCVSYSYGSFHQDFLKGKSLLIACPKLDDTAYYQEKLIEMFKTSDIKSVTVLHMEVPCCSGLVYITKKALVASNRKIPAKEITIGIKGDIKAESAM